MGITYSGCYHFKVTAIRHRFMEHDLRDTADHYITANDYDQALSHIYEIYKNGGWQIKSIEHEVVMVYDIRNKTEDKKGI